MAWRKIDDTKLTAIADAIRGKTGKTAAMTLDAMPTEIEAIEAGGGTSFDTCTVTISGCPYRSLLYTKYKDGVLEYVLDQDSLEDRYVPRVCEDVVCGSVIIVKQASMMSAFLSSVGGGVTDFCGNAYVSSFDYAIDSQKSVIGFKAPSVAGAEGSIVFEID